MSSRVYVGIDLGGRFHEVQVTSVEGTPLGRSFRIARGRRGLQELEEGLRRRVGSEEFEAVYTVEATQNYWMELIHPLHRSGARVHLVSPSKSSALRTFYRRHTKTDPIDAAALSQLPVVDPSLHEAFVGDHRFDTLRRLVRQYWQLKSQMANRKRRIMTRVLMVYPGYDKVFRNRYCGASLLFCRRYLEPSRARRLGQKRLGQILRRRAWGKFDVRREGFLWEVIENAPELAIDYGDLQFIVNQDLDLLEAEERSKQALKERIAEVYSEVDPELRLQSLPGLGEFLAAAITAFIGEPGRFTNANQVVALAGLYPRKKASAGTEVPNQRLSRHGDPTLRSVLYVAAEVCRHYDPELQAFHRRLTARGKHYKQASCALAAKILRRCFAVLRDHRSYGLTGSEAMEEAQTKRGKTVRQSVSEVAERLNDGWEPAPLKATTYSQDDATARAPITGGGLM
jgi:transposase